MNLGTLTDEQLQQARTAIIHAIAGYEYDAIAHVCDENAEIDKRALEELKQKVVTLRGVLRDIASAQAQLAKQYTEA